MDRNPNNNLNKFIENEPLDWINKAPYIAPKIEIGSVVHRIPNSIKNKGLALLQNIESTTRDAAKYNDFIFLFRINPMNVYYLGHALFLLNYKSPKTLSIITLIMKYRNAIKENFITYPHNIHFIMKTLERDHELGIQSTDRFAEFIIDLQSKIREGMSVGKAFDKVSESYFKLSINGGKKKTYRSRRYKRKQTLKKN